MKKNIRFFSALLAMSICVGALAACGSSTEQQTETNDVEVQEEAQDAATEVSTEEADNTADEETPAVSQEEYKILEEGDTAPDFTAKLVDGTEFKMSEHNNEVVLLNFFASWCGPCMGEMPAFEKLHNEKIPGLTILCVNCMEDMFTVDSLVKDEGYTFPVAYDVSGKIGEMYPTDGIPYTLVIKNGVIEKTFLGAKDADAQYEEYKSAIDECMK